MMMRGNVMGMAPWLRQPQPRPNPATDGGFIAPTQEDPRQKMDNLRRMLRSQIADPSNRMNLEEAKRIYMAERSKMMRPNVGVMGM